MPAYRCIIILILFIIVFNATAAAAYVIEEFYGWLQITKTIKVHYSIAIFFVCNPVRARVLAIIKIEDCCFTCEWSTRWQRISHKNSTKVWNLHNFTVLP